MKSAIQQAAELYQSYGLNFALELENYLRWGYVFCTPERLLLANDAKREDNSAHWVTDGQGDTWHVKLAIGKGCVEWFIRQAPYSKPWVAWAREFKTGKNALRFYNFDLLKTRVSALHL